MENRSGQTRESLLEDLERQVREISQLPTQERPRALEALNSRYADYSEVIKGLAALAMLDHAPSTRTADSPILRVGSYAVEHLIGEGGVGLVYIARDADGTQLAIKLLRDVAQSREILRRFERESAVLRALDHPSIARFVDSGEAEILLANGRTRLAPFLAMEHVDGRDLLAFATWRDLDVRERIRLMLRTCEGLAHAHGHGVVHRDIKPSNILVVDGQPPLPKILDFGIARAESLDRASESLTNVGTAGLLGTVPYMSPEQLTGGAKGLDARSDVFSVGVVMFELLTGELPHRIRKKSLPEVARAVRNEEPKRLGAVVADYRDSELERVLRKALQRSRDARHPSAAELASDLDRISQDT